MTDLWHEASEDHGAMARQAALSRAEGHLDPLWGFFFQAATRRELDHRLAVAETRLFHIASQSGVEVSELEDLVRRRHALLIEALSEGQDPVAQTVDSTRMQGGGPEQGYGHDEAVSYQYGYSEVPQGAPGGPVPQVVQPVFETPGAVDEATAAKKGGRCSCGKKLRNGKCKGCQKASSRCSCAPSGASDNDNDADDRPGPGGKMAMRRTARPASTQVSTLPAGAGGATVTPDGVSQGGLTTSTNQMPMSMPGAGTQTSQGGYDLTPAQSVTAGRQDAVARQVGLVAASVQASNPQLPMGECRRIARRVVGSYLRHGDLSSSVVSDEPWAGSPGGGQGGGGHGGMSGLEEYSLGKGLLSKLPGAGGGAGAAGEAGGAAGLADVAELAAL